MENSRVSGRKSMSFEFGQVRVQGPISSVVQFREVLQPFWTSVEYVNITYPTVWLWVLIRDEYVK